MSLIYYNDLLQNANNVMDDRLIELLNENMNTDEQTQFVKNFMIYLEHGNNDKAFIINLDNIWEQIGFSEKGKAKRLLINKFIENINYIIRLPSRASVDDSCNNIYIPSNKETILLNVTTFKKFCIIASTKKSNEICDYYLKMENIMNQYTKEKLIELENSNKQLSSMIQVEEIDINELFWNENSISNFNNKNVVYLSFIGYINGIAYYKYGMTKQIYTREFEQHKKTYDTFIMIHIELCDNMMVVENEFKLELKSKNLLRTLEINGKNQTELFITNPQNNIKKLIQNLKDLVVKFPLEVIKETQNEIEKMKYDYENEKLKIEIDNLTKEKNTLNNNYGEITEYFKDLKEDYKDLKKDHKELKRDNKELKENYKNLQEEHNTLKKEYTELNEKYAKLDLLMKQDKPLKKNKIKLVKEIIEPVNEIIEPVNEIIESVNEIIEPVNENFEYINEIIEPVNEIIEPNNENFEYINEIIEPVNEIIEPINELIEPSNTNQFEELDEDKAIRFTTVESFCNRYVEAGDDWSSNDKYRIRVETLYNFYCSKCVEPIERNDFNNFIKTHYKIESKNCTWLYKVFITWFGIKLKNVKIREKQIEIFTRSFIENYCTISEDAFIDTRIYHDTFRDYCNLNGFTATKDNDWSPSRCRSTLEKFGFGYKMYIIEGKKHGYTGLCLKTEFTIQDTIKKFINEKCILTHGARIKTTVLWDAFLTFDEIINKKNKKMKVRFNKVKFYNILIDDYKLVRKNITKGDIGFVGIKLKT
jgi:uncharacterized coiled-coil DUF342 family protein